MLQYLGRVLLVIWDVLVATFSWGVDLGLITPLTVTLAAVVGLVVGAHFAYRDRVLASTPDELDHNPH